MRRLTEDEIINLSKEIEGHREWQHHMDVLDKFCPGATVLVVTADYEPDTYDSIRGLALDFILTNLTALDESEKILKSQDFTIEDLTAVDGELDMPIEPEYEYYHVRRDWEPEISFPDVYVEEEGEIGNLKPSK